jgi:hypothetical protein
VSMPAEHPVEGDEHFVLSENDRPIRMCDSCGGVDDHPRHVFAYALGDGSTPAAVGRKALENARAISPEVETAVLYEVQDSRTTMKHMDCCRADGCPDGTCNLVTQGAESLKGLELVDHLVSLSEAETAEELRQVTEKNAPED